AKAVVEAARADPLKRPLVEEMDKTGKVSAPHRKATEGRKDTNGKVVFDDRKLWDAPGKLVRLINDRARALGQHKEPEIAKDHLDKVLAALKRWQKETP